jgi:hypothetical protein
MTPFGKPAARVTAADIQQLIDDKEPEGRYLEYTRDIPISDEEQKQARGAGRGDPQDRSWLQNRPLRAFGRDKLMEELVAFANADGGVLILGITETKSEPARANGFNLLPDVVSLERRLRDALVDCIEPRLPFASVVAVPIAPSGEGVVILETEPSRLGPHRVRGTREATIRREDRCDQMTMAEIHDMVIHNARRLDAVTATLEERAKVFQKTFFRTLLATSPTAPSSSLILKAALIWGSRRREWLRLVSESPLSLTTILASLAYKTLPALFRLIRACSGTANNPSRTQT